MAYSRWQVTCPPATYHLPYPMKLGTNKHLLDKQKIVRRTQARRRAGLFFILVLLVVGGVVWLLHRPQMRLQTISVHGTSLVPSEAVLTLARAELDGKYAYLVPRDNFLFYPREKLKASIFANYLRVASIAITEESRTALSIVIREREPEAVWCKKTTDLILPTEQEEPVTSPKSSSCYYVDATGLLYDVAPTFSGSVYFEISGVIGDAPRLGSRILPIEMMHRVIHLRALLSGVGIASKALSISSGYNFTLHTSDGWRLLFYGDALPEELIERISTVLDSEMFIELMKKKDNPLSYIDLRYGNKIFYMFTE